MQPVQDLGHLPGANAAWETLAAGLLGVELGQDPGHVDDIHRLVTDDNAAGPEHSPGADHRVEVNLHVDCRSGQEPAQGAAGL